MKMIGDERPSGKCMFERGGGKEATATSEWIERIRRKPWSCGRLCRGQVGMDPII